MYPTPAGGSVPLIPHSFSRSSLPTSMNLTLNSVSTFLQRLDRKVQGLRHERYGPRPQKDLTIGAAYERGWADIPCTFALSTGRAGTQTLATLLNQSLYLRAVHEPAPRLVQASYDAFMEADAPDWLDRWAPFVRATRDDLILDAARAGQTYVETSNRMSLLAPALATAFPGSSFLFVYRHPLKVIRSSMQRGAYQGSGMAWNFARPEPRSSDPYHARWPSLSPVEKEAWRWTRVNEDALSFMASLPAERRFQFSSESFFERDPAVLDGLFDFLHVPAPTPAQIDQVLQRKMNAQAHFNGLDFEWTDDTLGRVVPIVQDVAYRLGYTL